MSNDPLPSFKSWKVSPENVGCTAVVCCVRPDSLTVANAGDSRAVLCRWGKAIDMSEDHKPNLPGELARIQRAGGSIVEQRVAGTTHYRVNGNLNLSRSIGDLLYKQNPNLAPEDQMIACHPDIQHFWRQAGDEFMVIACDGVWDVLSSQDVCDFIRPRLGNLNDLPQRLQEGSFRLSSITEELLDTCLSPDLSQTMGLGGDNMTIVLVIFGSGQRQDSWLDASQVLVGGPSFLCPYK
ncbi:unnamed protein product [Polarella glacialis]|nr:unnamed protein product [Polarella glacialis]